MKDSEFIELLNLYLDHEISAADATRLDAEVQRSPERRRVYREYCQMQKACVLLAEEAAEIAPSTDSKVISFAPPSRSWGFGAYATGLCAAAACIALALVVRNGNGSALSAPRAADHTAVSSVQIAAQTGADEVRRGIPLTVSLNPRGNDLQPVFVAQSLALTKQQRAAAPAISSDPRFDWMNRVQVASVQRVSADELHFEVKPAPQPDGRTFRSRRLIDGQLEQAAYQFQR